jgi:hypothetical protein
MRRRGLAIALLALLAACGGGGGGGASALEGGGAPASPDVDPLLVGSYEAFDWVYDYADGTTGRRSDFDDSTWRLDLGAEGTYFLYKDWWQDGHFTSRQEEGTWSVRAATEGGADGTLRLHTVERGCTEAYSYAAPTDDELSYWRNDGPGCDGTRPYDFYRVDWRRVE